MSLRTYCVIPHYAREDASFFQGVFEDGIRVLYQGRLQSLLFSHVLSPAHDYVKHINGPLLATLREGGNATLLVATPNSEHISSSSSATVPSSSTTCEGIAEVTSTTMGLYHQLFPLLFRNLERCATAQLSAVTASAADRVLLDNLRDDRRIRDITEAQRLTLHRRTSAMEWGTLLQLLEARHAAMETSTTSLEGQTACVVTVELDGYGRLVVVDTASSQELLQQLTLILGMGMDGDQRTYPSHTLLRDLLAKNVVPHATVQVVCVPAPQDTVRQTMRVLHFGSTLEAWRSKNSNSSDHSRESSSRSLAVFSTRKAGEESGALGGPSKRFSRPAAAPSVSFDVDGGSRRGGSAERVGEMRGASSPSRDPCNAADMGERAEIENASRSNSSRVSAPRSEPQRYTEQVEFRSSAVNSIDSHDHESTPAQLPPPNLTTIAADNGRQRAREEQLKRRVAMLEAQVRELQISNCLLKTERGEAMQAKERVELEWKSKSSAWAHLQRAHTKAKQENADYAQLVQKLLRQVRVLEKDTSRQKRQDMSVVKELRQVREEKTVLEAQVTRLRKEVMLFRREATYRAREATLSRIGHRDTSTPPQGAPRGTTTGSSSSLCRNPQQQQSSIVSPAAPSTNFAGRGRSNNSLAKRDNSTRRSPRARRLYDTATDEENDDSVISRLGTNSDAEGAAEHNLAHRLDSSSAPSAQSQRVTDITLEELRWRNRHLEQEVTRLQERVLSAITSANSPPKVGSASLTTCQMCDAMRERVDYFQSELAHLRDEKDRLLNLLRNSNTREATRLRVGRLAQDVDAASDASTAVGGEEELNGVSKKGSTQIGRAEHVHRNDTAVNASAAHNDLSFSFSSSQTKSTAVRGVAAALLAGCASLEAQLECAQAALNQRLRRIHSSPDALSSSHTDPLSHISAQVLVEHHEAVAALAESLRHIAEKPATSLPLLTSRSQLCPSPSSNGSIQQQQQQQPVLLPPVPRTATAGNAETLTRHLAFEEERSRHLRAFIPTFAQLAVATEHLLMRLEATESAV